MKQHTNSKKFRGHLFDIFVQNLDTEIHRLVELRTVAGRRSLRELKPFLERMGKERQTFICQAVIPSGLAHDMRMFAE